MAHELISKALGPPADPYPGGESNQETNPLPSGCAAQAKTEMANSRTTGFTAALTLVWLLGAPAGGPGVGAKQADPIEVRRLQDLRFGFLGADATSDGWALIEPGNGARQVGGGVYGMGGGYGPAEFEVVGEPGAQFSIDLPNRVRIDSTVGVRNFASVPTGVGTLGANGRATLTVGALLEVRGRAVPGPRSDQFTVKVEYL